MDLITQNVSEIIGRTEIKQKLDNQTTISAYWGIEPTKPLTIDHLIPLIKIRDLTKANIYVKILIADVHAFLNKKNSEDRTYEKMTYYKFIITTILDQMNVDKNMYSFEIGSDVQLDKRYIIDLYKFMSMVKISQVKLAGNMIVKQNRDPILSDMVYPLMQILDETVLDADIQIGGIEQKKIFQMSRDYKKRLGYNNCSYLITPHIPSLYRSLSIDISSRKKIYPKENKVRINLTDDKNTIYAKIDKLYCLEKKTNLYKAPCLSICKYILYPLNHTISEYKTYDELKIAWSLNKISPYELKPIITTELNKIINPLRLAIENNIEIYNNAYEDGSKSNGNIQ